jgi:hypothetical protein
MGDIAIRGWIVVLLQASVLVSLLLLALCLRIIKEASERHVKRVKIEVGNKVLPIRVEVEMADSLETRTGRPRRKRADRLMHGVGLTSRPI